MNNYQYCAEWIERNRLGNDVRVLDYGCGAGAIVAELVRRRIDAFGCDVFYEGGDSSAKIPAEIADRIRRMEGDAIPFDDEAFDFVVSNQVMEHVEDLDGALAEICRVLKPGGLALSLFPDRSVWREGHCGVPLLHRFPKGSRFRVYYAAFFRALGFGRHKGTKGVMQWSEDFCRWLDRWTWYRDRREIDAAYARYFDQTRSIEDDWLYRRLGAWRALVRCSPVAVQQFVVRKFSGMVLVSRKPLEHQ